MHRRTIVEPCKIERRAGLAPRRRTGSPAPAMATFAASLSIGASSAAMAGPTGGTVVQGQGTISTPSSTQTVINQSSQQLTLNWSSFNVGANESVRFYQPSSTSVAFNRILGQSASQIFGQIDANGQVVLINPNGLLIGRTAQLNVSSLIVSSLDAIDFNAASGGYRFSATRSAPGSVINEGLITAQPGGSVTLLGGHVSNSGTIVADYGTVNLAAGRTATLDLAGDGLLRLEVGADLVANPDGAVSAVENSGSIVANGGHVLLTASAVKNVFENLVNNTGVVRANRIDNSGGTIELLGPGGTVLSSGTLDASAGDRVSTGGSVSVEGDRVGLLGNAVVNVSGATGGGTALIGGDTHGANPEVLDATQAYVSSGTTIDADAGATGDGGRVVVWSNEFTQYYGSLSARGGSLWGNGGSAEVSGKQTLEFAGMANLTAPHGIWGTLLLDPASITIDGSDSATDTTTSQSLTIPNTYPSGANAGDAVTIGSQVIEGLLETGNVSLSATTTITQSNNVIIDSSADSAAQGSGLTLHAGTGISLGTNSQINTNNGAIVLETDTGNITLNSGASLNAGSAAATLIAGGSLVGNVVTLTGAGSIVSNSAGPITTSGLLTLAAGGPIGASGAGNAINTNAGSIVATANAGDIFLAPQNNTTLTDVTAVGAGNSVTITGTGNLAVVSVSGDGVTLEAPNGAISDAGSGTNPVVSSTSGLTLSAGTAIGTAPAVITNLAGGSPLYVQESTGITAAVTSPTGQIDLNVTNLTGPVTLNTGAITLGGSSTTNTGSVVVQADGDIDVFPDAIQVSSALTAQVAVNSTGGTVALQPGSIVTDKAPATLLLSGTDITSGSSSTPHTFTLAAGDLDFIASAPSGDIVLNTAVTRLDANIGGAGGAGNLTVNQAGDLNLGAISAAGTVTVDVTGGAINGVNLSGSQSNVTSNQITLEGTSIGSGSPVTTAATSSTGTTQLTATGAGGVDVVQQTGNLAVQSASGSSVALTSGGSLTETAGGTITSDQITLQGVSIGTSGTAVNTFATSGAATTVLSATATAGVVNVSQQLGSLAVDSVSGSSVALASTQAITETSGGGNITSGQITLQGTSIGASSAPVDLAATSGAGTSVLSAASGGAVFLSQEVGNVAVNSVSGSSVSLGSNGAITEATGGGNITSNQVTLQGQSIGANGVPVNLAATSGAATTVLSANASGAVYISQQIGTLGVDSISGSSVNLAFNDALVETAGGGNITSNQITLGGILVGGNGTPVDIAATSSGATTVVSATTGDGIYLAQQTGNETLSASSSAGPVSVTTANGGNLAVNTVSGISVSLASSGALTQAAGGGNITSNQINLQGTSIGISTAAIDTAATSGAATTVLNATATGGGVYVAQQTGALAVESANGTSVALTSGGALTETVGGNITSDQITLQGASIGTSTQAVNTFAASSTDTTVLSATAGAGAFVDQQSGTLAVASVSGTSVGLTSTGAMIEASGGGNITSNQITLQGASIGTSTAAIDTAATSGAATTVLNATAGGGGVYVAQQTGALAVASASGTSVALTSGGALTESIGGTITSDQITLQGASIGTSATALNTFAASIADTTVLSAIAGGGVYIAQQTGTLAVNSVSGASVALTSAGAITEAAGGSNITSNQVTLQGTSIGTSTAAVDTAATSAAATTALNATTTAPGGAIYVAQQIGNVNVTANANGALVDVTTSNGGLTAASVTGNGVTLAAGGTGQGLSVSGPVNGASSDVSLSATGGINLSALVSTTTGVSLSAGGAITTAGGGQITANLLTATAATIGTAVSPLNTTVISLDTTSTAGGTFIAQSGDVTVSSAAAGPLDIQTTDGNLTETSAIGNTITLVAGGANKVLTVNSTLNGGADDVTLGASGDGGNIVLNGSVSTTGNATLDAGSSTVGGTITEAAGVSVTSTGLTLLAASIGNPGSPLATNATSLNATSTNGGIYVAPTAGLALTASATGGAVDVETSNGPLTVASAAGDGVTLATNGVGNALTTTGTVDGRAVGVTLSTSGAGSNIILGGGVTSTGDVSLGATGAGSSIALNSFLGTAGNVSITAGSAASPGIITAGTGGGIAANTLSITGASIGSGAAPLTTAAGSVNATSLDGGIYVQQADALSLNATATGGSVNAATTNGALTVLSATGAGVTLASGGVGQNLNVDGAINGGTGVVSLSAPGGAITAGAGESVAGASLTATAVSIGSSTAPLATTVGTLNATSSNGGIYVANTEALALTVSATGGEVDVSTDGALTVKSTGSLDLTANATGGALTVTTTNGPLAVESASGTGVALNAGGTSGAIYINGSVNGDGGNVSLATAGALVAGPASQVTADNLTVSASQIGTNAAPFNTAANSLSATSTAPGGIYVSQSGPLVLNGTATGGALNVQTTNGTLTLGTAVGSVVTLVDNGGAIVAGSGNSVAGNSVTLQGSSIGASGTPVNTATPSLDATSTNGGIYVQQTGDMALTASATGGPLDVNTGGALTVASASGAEVTLTAGGAITGGAGSQINATALTASGSTIGSSGSPLMTNVSSLNTTSANGGTYVNNAGAVTLTAAATGGALNVQTVNGALTVDAATGAGVTLAAGGAGSGITVSGAVSAGTGDVSLTAGTAASRGAIAEGAGGQVTGGTLSAVAASIGSSAAPLSTAVGSLTANTSTGDIDIAQQGSLKLANVQAAGSLDISAANGDIVVGNVSAANNATLTANSGAINDDGDDTTRVTANTVTLLARSIGAPSTLAGTTVDSSQRLDTDATNLVATSTAGGVYINQLTGLSSASVHASGGKDGNIELLTKTGDINILSMNASGTLLLAAGGNIYALPGAGTITAQAAELRAGGADPTAGHIGTLGRPLILQLAAGDTLRMFVPQTVNSSDPNSAPSTLPSAGVESTLVLFAAPSSLAVDAGFGQFTGLSQSQFTSQAELLVHSIQNQTASVESVLGLDWSSFDPNVSLFGKLDPSVCLPGDQRDEEQGADGKGEKCVAP